MARSHSPSIEALLEPLYASVLDPARFEDFAGLLRKAMNGHLVALQTDDASHRHNVLTHFWECGADAQPPDYVNDASINLFFARGAQAFAAHGVLDGSTLFAPGELERTAFYREVLTVLDVQHSMGFLLATEPQGRMTALSVSRDRKRAPFEPERMQLAQRLLAHLRNVYQLQQRLQHSTCLASAFDQLDTAAWLLGGDGGLQGANAAAEDLLDTEQAGIRVLGNALSACWKPDRAALRDAIDQAVHACTQASDVLLHDPLGSPWAVCHLHPLPPGSASGWALAQPPRAIAIMRLLQRPRRPCRSALRQAFSLTPAEALLAEALLVHGSLPACERVLGKRRETLRSQLKGLFAKTGTHRQADLLRRLESAAC